jgi:hypothetical protein
VSYPGDGKPRYAVGVISGAAIQPSGDGQKAGPAAYVYDRARCFKIVYEYRGRQALAQAERKAAQLERWMSGEPPQPIPAGSKYRHGTYSAYQYCGDLPKIERRLRDERALVDSNLRHVIDVLATLPRGRGRFPMFDSPEADLPRMSDELHDAVEATKGTEG